MPEREPIQAHRLKRLMRLMIEVGSREFHSAEELYRPLGISRTQFYADKADLETMGFSFSFDHRRKTYAIEEDPGVKVEGLTLGEILALILAVGRLPETGDFILAYRALCGLRKIAIDRPGPAADFVIFAVDEFVIRDGYGVEFDLLDTLVQAVAEKRRVHLVYQKPGAARSRRLNVDPEKLFFKGGRLFLEGRPETGTQRLFQVSHIREAIVTPFFAP